MKHADPASSSDELARLGYLAEECAKIGSRELTSAIANRDPIAKGLSGDVVTATDEHIEKVLRDVISRARPDDLIIGEELPDSGTGASGIHWFLDPIDGTSNFVLGLAHYGTSVAAYSANSGEWLAGAVSMPLLDTMFVATKGRGARRIVGDKTVRLDARSPEGAPRMLGIGLSYDPGQRAIQMARLPADMEGYDDARSFGSAALALCFVADGSLGAFIESDLYVFDWAAGALIAEEAGATVIRPDGLHRGGISAFGVNQRLKP